MLNLIESAKCFKTVKGSGLSRERVFRWNSTRKMMPVAIAGKPLPAKEVSISSPASLRR